MDTEEDKKLLKKADELLEKLRGYSTNQIKRICRELSEKANDLAIIPK